MRISDWSSDVCSSDLGELPARRFGRAIDRLAAGVTIDFAAVERVPSGFLAATGPPFEQDGLLAGGDLARRIAVVVGWAAHPAIWAAPVAAHIRYDLTCACFDVQLHRTSFVNGIPTLGFIHISRRRANGRDICQYRAWPD